MKNSYKYIYTCRMQHNVKNYSSILSTCYCDLCKHVYMINLKISYFFENAMKCAINVRFGHHINYPTIIFSHFDFISIHNAEIIRNDAT